MANQDVLLGYYGDFANNDFAKMQAERFHPDITWTMPGHHPMSGTMQGADAVIAFLKKLYTAGIRVDNVHLGELDDGTLIASLVWDVYYFLRERFYHDELVSCKS